MRIFGSKARTKTGQTILEYSLMIALIVGGIAASAVYLTRAIKGKFKAGMDQVTTAQFSPTRSNLTLNVNYESSTHETTLPKTTTNTALAEHPGWLMQSKSTLTKGEMSKKSEYDDFSGTKLTEEKLFE